MKRARFLLVTLLLFAGCNLSKPTDAINSWKTAFGSGDFEKMLTFYSQPYIADYGAERIKIDLNQRYDQEKAEGRGKLMQSSNLKEHINGEKADVCWQESYTPPGGLKILAHMVKEKNGWKINSFGTQEEADACLK